MASMHRVPGAERSSASGSAAASTRRPQERQLGDEEEGQANSNSEKDDKEDRRSSSMTERTALLAELDRHEERYYKLKSCESIYSFYLFMPAIEHRQTGSRCNYIFGFALGLVLLNMAMQFGLMYVVSVDAIRRQQDFERRLIPMTNGPWYQVHTHFTAAPENCLPESLCVYIDQQISCTPRSIALLDHWPLLDLNGDGIWSKSEADNETHRAAMRCHFGADPLALYGQMLIDIQAQPALSGGLHTKLVHGTGVHKAYFDWYLGEPLLCRYIDEDMCGNLFQKGFFDEAIRHGAQFKPEITDLDSARRYCSNLLRHRCQHILPSSYHIWRADAQRVCGAKDFTTITYNSPDKDPNNSFNVVQHKGVVEYQKYRSWLFMGYLATLLLTFFSTMLAEWKDIYRTFLYCLQFPSIRGGSNDGVQRYGVLFITVLRTLLWCVLLYGGTIFLTSKTDYLGIIFDALSLAFIITIDELIYATMLRPPMKSVHQELEALLLHRRRQCFSVHCLEVFMLVVVVLAAVVVACSFQWQELKPIHQALECLCSAEGPTCREATLHGKTWWDAYWTNMAAASWKIEQLRTETQ